MSFVSMAASVGVNLAVAHMDRQGKSERGDRIDRRCRIYFPLAYFGLNALAALFFLVVW
jgi:hypothetical protein